jgi:hypothetical protein
VRLQVDRRSSASELDDRWARHEGRFNNSSVRSLWGGRVVRFLVWAIASAFRPRARMIAENLCLRQQLLVLQRRHPQPRLGNADRRFWIIGNRWFSSWRGSLLIVKPALEPRAGSSPAPVELTCHPCSHCQSWVGFTIGTFEFEYLTGTIRDQPTHIAHRR